MSARSSHQSLSAALPVALGFTAALLSGCSDGSNPTGPDYDPVLPTAWVSEVTNPWFPLVPGTSHRYSAETEDGPEIILVEVLSRTKTIMGVTARAVRDRVWIDGVLVEDTEDWYAQDLQGNVWYLGEATTEYEGGVAVGTDGSFEWGVDGALPGIIMWADPGAHVGEEYRQEYYEEEAEDWGRVIAIGERVSVPVGQFDGCIQTEDWNGLESGTLEHKWYCPGIGFVLEMKVEGGDERVELVEIAGGGGS